ncbi:membrane alanyl aminopeptidase [Sarracenia purpurea var. burkii]
MPTYLVSYMISDFIYVTNTENNVRVVARRAAITARQALYALNQGAKILQQLEGYFGIANKIPKMDIVAVPDFKLGGMENWGMVTFKERFVLAEEATSSAQHRHIITQLLSHEFAHQWFGDLVTPAWYNNLWLKEGFATYSRRLLRLRLIMERSDYTKGHDDAEFEKAIKFLTHSISLVTEKNVRAHGITEYFQERSESFLKRRRQGLLRNYKKRSPTQTGFCSIYNTPDNYRVNYDIQNWNLLIDQLQKDHQKIPVLNRAQLIADVYALAYDEHLTYKMAIKLTEYLSKETDMIPWYAAIKAFNVLRFKLQSTSGDIFFKKYLYDLVKKSYETIGFEIKSTDSHLVKIVKPLYLMLACNLEIEDCITKSLNEYKTNEADLTNKIQPDVKRVVYCHALRKSADQPTVFNNLWTTYTKYDISYEKQQILTALTCATDEEIIKRILSKMIDPQNKENTKTRQIIFPKLVDLATTGDHSFSEIHRGLNDNGVKLLKDLLNSMEYNIQTQDQLLQLKDLETKFSSLDQNKYAEFTSIVKNLQLTSANTVKKDAEKFDRLHKEYLQSSDTKSETNPDTKKDTDKDSKGTTDKPTKPSNGAANSIPNLGWRLFTAGIVLCYSLSRFRVL